MLSNKTFSLFTIAAVALMLLATVEAAPAKASLEGTASNHYSFAILPNPRAPVFLPSRASYLTQPFLLLKII